MTRLAENGVAYNRFHTTAMCSPTRAAMMTGRNHHHVGAGQIAEFACDFDGYIGEIPQETATIAQILSEYGYNTGAFGKWHNTPITDLTTMGPFDQYPTGLGFRHFYGFLAGENSQYEPRLFENTNPIEPPKTADEGAPCMGRTMCPKSGPTSTKASSTAAGKRCAKRPTNARKNWAGYQTTLT
jgi:arylsulfatase